VNDLFPFFFHHSPQRFSIDDHPEDRLNLDKLHKYEDVFKKKRLIEGNKYTITNDYEQLKNKIMNRNVSQKTGKASTKYLNLNK